VSAGRGLPRAVLQTHKDCDRHTSAVHRRNDLRHLATLSLAHSCTPFFCGAKLPSMKASSNFLSRVSAVYG